MSLAGDGRVVMRLFRRQCESGDSRHPLGVLHRLRGRRHAVAHLVVAVVQPGDLKIVNNVISLLLTETSKGAFRIFLYREQQTF